MGLLEEWSGFHRLALFIGLAALIVALWSGDLKGAVLMAFVTVSIVPEGALSRRWVLAKYLLAGILAVVIWAISSGWLRWAFLCLGLLLIGYVIWTVQKF